MADITIDADVYSYLHPTAQRGGPFWTSTTTGYVIYVNSDKSLVYSKTANGGATWGADVNISGAVNKIFGYDCFADWQTVGDTGTKIHIAYLDKDEGGIVYTYLDTSTDTIGSQVGIHGYGEATFHSQTIREHQSISIAKGRGGKLGLAYRVTSVSETQLEGFYTSPDGTTWTSKTIPWEDAEDYIELYPGNEADNHDLWAAFWDRSANEISLKTYDDSGNSWSEQSIASSMLDSGTYLQMGGQVRLSDGHLIFAAWDAYGYAGTANLKVWDINGAASITAKTNVITNTQHYFLVSVFLNQINDDIYVAYVGGTAIIATVAAKYKKSTDGGSSWGSQTAMQADAEDDERWITAGCMKATWGGKFQPVWFNDDLDDLFTNTDNGISIAVGGAGAEGMVVAIAAKMIAGKLI